MNFIVFDPSFLQENRLKDLINSYKVSEIYSLLPYCEKTDTLLSNSSVPVSVKRQKGETIDSVKRRAVYSFVSKIFHPIIAYGEYIGQCDVSDMFKDSRWNSFSANLRTGDPNILILQISSYNKKYEVEESSIKLFTYIFNILKKHSRIDYMSRICITTLLSYITSERWWCVDREHLKELWQFGRNGDDLAAYFLTDEGMDYRQEIIKEEEEEVRKNRVYDNDGYIDDLKAELDYIRNNGGDWIDD